MRFAADLTGVTGTIAMRGASPCWSSRSMRPSAALAVAAAWGFWIRNPHAPTLAAFAVAASAAVTVQSLCWSRLPGNAVPGERLPVSVVAIAHAAGWIAFLRKSRRVRAVYGRCLLTWCRTFVGCLALLGLRLGDVGRVVFRLRHHDPVARLEASRATQPRCRLRSASSTRPPRPSG